MKLCAICGSSPAERRRAVCAGCYERVRQEERQSEFFSLRPSPVADYLCHAATPTPTPTPTLPGRSERQQTTGRFSPLGSGRML